MHLKQRHSQDGGAQSWGFSLGTKVVLFSLLIVYAVLFSVASHPVLRIASALVLWVLCVLTAVPMTEFILSLPEWLRERAKIERAKKIDSSEVSGKVTILGKMMGVAFRKTDCVRVVDAWCNAGVASDGTIYLGQTIVEEFDGDSLCGVLAHELAHKKARHHDKMLMLLMILCMPAVGLLMMMQLPACITVLVAFAIVGLALPVSTWPFEYCADEIAASYVGAQPVISALERLARENNIEIHRDTYTHPSISRRIANLRLLEISVSDRGRGITGHRRH